MGSLPLLHWRFNLLHFKIIFSVSSSGERWMAEVRHWVFWGRAFLMLSIHKAPRISQLCFRGSHHLYRVWYAELLSSASVLSGGRTWQCVAALTFFTSCVMQSPFFQRRWCPSGCPALPRRPLTPKCGADIGGPAGHVNFGLLHLMGNIYPVSFPMLLSTEKWYFKFFLTLLLLLHLFIVCMCMYAHVWRSEVSLWKAAVSFRSVGHRDRT